MKKYKKMCISMEKWVFIANTYIYTQLTTIFHIIISFIITTR